MRARRWAALLAVLIMSSVSCGAEGLRVALTDQLGRRILVYELSETGSPLEMVYAWLPTEELGFHQVDGYQYPSDVRLRRRPAGDQVLLTCASHGFCAMAAYPSGERLWDIAVDAGDNPHAIELLPNGCIAIAASSGNYIRIYAAGSADPEFYSEYFLRDAHGLLWDPELNVLWAVGKSILAAYELAGTPEKPELVEREDLRAALPVANGHDVWPVYGDPNRLWIVCGGVFQYDKTGKNWIQDYDGAEKLQGSNVKSIGDDGDGTIIRTIPNGTYEVWNTDTLDIYRADTELITAYALDGMAFYRARIWSDRYQ